MSRKLSRKLLLSMAFSAMCVTTSFAAFEPGYITPHDNNLVGSNVVYQYDQNNQFKVRGTLGYLTDLTLGRNEKLTGIVAGNTNDWSVSSAVVDQTPHVYLKPIKKDAKPTNLIVNTNKRSYRFVIREDEHYDDVVSFSNLTPSIDTASASIAGLTQKEKVEAENEAYSINRDYKYEKVQNVRKSLVPTNIWDDGNKTYIEIPTNNLRNLPVVYSVDKKGKLSMVNSRLIGNHVVVDTVLARLQIRYKTDSYLTVVNNKEAGRKPIKIKDLNKLLNQSVDVPDVASIDGNEALVPNNVEVVKEEAHAKAKKAKSDATLFKESLKKSVKASANKALEKHGVVVDTTQQKPRIIITRDANNNPVDNIVNVATTKNNAIEWVPLKERIAKLQQEGGHK